MGCVNQNHDKYHCQSEHREGRCRLDAVREACVASCACSDDHYNRTLGRFASAGCAPPAEVRRSHGTLLLVNSNLRSPYVAGFLATRPPHQQTLIVFGGHDETEFIPMGGDFAALYVDHDSIDFTALIGLVEHLTAVQRAFGRFDRVFYVHDTVRIHNAWAFARALRRYDLCLTCSLQMGQSMNLGIYALDDLRRNAGFMNHTLRGRSHPTRKERLQQKTRGKRGWEGVLFSKMGAWSQFATCGCELSRGPDRVGLVNDTNNEMHLRMEMIYSEWGLSKYQSRGTLVY